MRKLVTYVASVAGAAALIGTVLTGALANRPEPFHPLSSTAKSTNIAGDMQISGVLKVQKNNSIYGKLYAHGGEQVWQGLLVHSGGVKSDSIDVAGPAQMQSATVAGNLQAGAITGTSLNVSGAVTLGAAVTAGGKVTANGMDAGAGGLTTSGTVTAAGVNVNSITDSGTLNAGSVTSAGAITGGSLSTTGQLTAGSASFSGPVSFAAASFTGLKATGAVDLSAAQITLPANFFNLSGQTVSSLTVGALNVTSALSLGSTNSTTSPLSISQNGKTASLNVDANGNVSTNSMVIGNLTVSSSLTLANGATIPSLQTTTLAGAPAPGTTSSTPGPLTLQGSQLTIATNNLTIPSNTNVTNGADVALTTTTGGTTPTAAHLVAPSNPDVAGLIAFNGTGFASGAEVTPAQTVTFNRIYKNPPTVVLTAMGINGANGDPAPGAGIAPKVWVTLIGTSGNYTGFTAHYVYPSGFSAPASISVVFAYHVIGT